MKAELFRTSSKPLLIKMALVAVLLLVPISILALSSLDASVNNMEIASVAGGGGLSDGGSFYVTTSVDGRYVAFYTLATNLAPEPSGEDNWSDVFLRDRLGDRTIKVTKSFNGGLTNESSYDPTLTADGRYVAYFSYASDIVPNDNNGAEWSREGLDVFVFDRHSGQNTRVSLTSEGKEIDGNSVGSISADGQYILFTSNGRVMPGQWSDSHRSAMYLRDWHQGDIERISVATDGGFPNRPPQYGTISSDNRYVVFGSEASNLVPDDTNGHMDVFLYDRMTKKTKLITRDTIGRPANGRSSQPEISRDGQSITFLSFATNLVVGDANGEIDIFVYDLSDDKISLVSRAENGDQANGSSREPSVCGEGRFISYTTDATNLFPNDNNNQRDVILYDRVKGTNSVATVNWNGAIGNGKAHRSFLTPDCRSIAFASDATNLVPNDVNNQRDIFVGEIELAADFSPSTVGARGAAQPGESITYTFDMSNIGTISSTAVLVSKVPTNTTYLAGSTTNGAVFEAGENQVTWRGTVEGSSEVTVSYAVVVEPTLAEPTAIGNLSTLSGDGSTYSLTAWTITNPFQTRLMMVRTK